MARSLHAIGNRRQAGQIPPPDIRAGGRLPDDVVQGMRLEERSELDSRIAVGSDQFLGKRFTLSARPGARNESGEVPRDGADAHVLEVVPDEPAVGVQQIRHRDVPVKRLRGQRALEHGWGQCVAAVFLTSTRQSSSPTTEIRRDHGVIQADSMSQTTGSTPVAELKYREQLCGPGVVA